MKALGVALVVVGAFVGYLGYQGKLGDAWTALLTGKAPGA